jgi:hypothetical protein
MSFDDEPTPPAEPEQLRDDDQLGDAGEPEPAGHRHRGPSDDATADIEERQEDGYSDSSEPGRPPDDAPAY